MAHQLCSAGKTLAAFCLSPAREERAGREWERGEIDKKRAALRHFAFPEKRLETLGLNSDEARILLDLHIRVTTALASTLLHLPPGGKIRPGKGLQSPRGAASIMTFLMLHLLRATSVDLSCRC